MSSAPSLDFETIANALLEAGALGSPSELQGMLVGQLAGGKRFSRGEWQQEALQWLDASGELALLVPLYDDTVKSLEDGELGLRLLLPDDEEALDVRTQALGEWCQGFLEGFALGGGRTPPAEVTELLQDLSAISQIGLTDEDGAQEDEQNEVNYAEIEEYVRIAALTIFAECGRKAEKPKPPTLH